MIEADVPRDEAHDLELALVRAIEQLPGVLAAAVWLNDARHVRAVHITSAPAASGTIISNAAAHLLRRHGLAFTLDMIRVAYRDGPVTREAMRPPTAAPVSGRFLILQDLTIQRSGSHVTCRVVIARGDEVFEGEARELDTEAGRARAAARAALSAAERAGEVAALALGLEGTSVLEMFGRKYVAASVEAAVDRRFALLAGIVPIDPARSIEEAACLAALRAVDRWIAW
jgi:hypothetical protein